MDTSHNSLKAFAQHIIGPHSEEEQLIEILDAFFPLLLGKNQFLVEEGSICPFFCFIEDGILQHAITIEGEEKTTYLGLKNTVTSALESFKNNTPSRKSIRALCETKLYVLSIDSFKNLLSTNPLFHKFYHTLIENQIFLIDDARIDLLILSPEDRYRKLVATEPKLLQEVPLYQLSSLLGISTRQMSRIRKNIN